MPEDLSLLLIASLVATRLVAQLLRGGGAQQAPYLVLLGVDLALLGSARAFGPRAQALAFVAQCAGVVLVLAPGLLDALERRALRRGDERGLRRATLVARARELLVPGTASSSRRRTLEQRIVARAGDASHALRALEEERAGTRDPELARQLTVELVLLKLAAGQIDEALEQAQRQLGAEAYDRSPTLTAAVIGALAEQGRLREAAPLLALLETQAAGRDVSAQPLLLGARLAFVAGAGLTELLERLLAERALSSGLPAGEAARLRAAAAAVGVPEPEARFVAEELARRLLELGQRSSVSFARRAPVTLALLVANLVVIGAVTLLGLGGDELGLARAGALYGPAVKLGEWWRLLTAMFLHAGPLHLVANMYGLYLLGRATEELLGGARMLIVYAVAGIGGALASLWADRGLSVGASGAIMGLLAALTAIVFARRHHFHPAARRMLLGNLVFLGALQAFLGWQIPMIDSAAHAGGFVAGLLATLGVGPKEELGPGGRRLAWMGAGAFVLATLLAAVLVLRCPLERTLLALPTAAIELEGIRAEVPRAWRKEGKDLLVDRYLGIELRLSRSGDSIRLGSPQADDPRVRPLLERISKSARPSSQTP